MVSCCFAFYDLRYTWDRLFASFGEDRKDFGTLNLARAQSRFSSVVGISCPCSFSYSIHHKTGCLLATQLNTHQLLKASAATSPATGSRVSITLESGQVINFGNVETRSDVHVAPGKACCVTELTILVSSPPRNTRTPQAATSTYQMVPISAYAAPATINGSVR